MGRSPGFASIAADYLRPFETRFPYGFDPEDLNRARDGNSPDHYAKGTPSPCVLLHIGLRPLVGMWFQVQYPPLTGVLPIFRSRYLFTIGRQRVLSLGRWTSRIQTRFHVTGFTRGHTRSRFAFTYGTVTRYGLAFHRVLLANRFVTPY